MHAFRLHTHSSHLFSLCQQKTLKYVACPQDFGSFCFIFLLRHRKGPGTHSLFVLFFFCTDITNGYFNWNFWHCLHLVSEWQTSEWLARPGLGWLVCSEACLNQLAAWIACLILTGFHWNPWLFFFLWASSLEKCGITNKGERWRNYLLIPWSMTSLLFCWCKLLAFMPSHFWILLCFC